MICSQRLRSSAKLSLVRSPSTSVARSLSMISPAQGEPLQPFCGALMITSTPLAAMSTQAVPEATQSSTKIPPASCTASATAFR